MGQLFFLFLFDNMSIKKILGLILSSLPRNSLAAQFKLLAYATDFKCVSPVGNGGIWITPGAPI